MEIKNLKEAAERIKQAIKKKERIILYGDSDMDGISSVIILKETIKNLNGDVDYLYFPDRQSEGYGINEDAIKFLFKFSPALLIAVDCGIGNFKEVKLAKKFGFEVIIIDHHSILNKLPEASIVVNPHQKGDRYSFKNFAAAGIVFKLAQVLLGEKLTDSLRSNFLELTALATLSDMMPQVDENLEFLEHGLVFLKRTLRPGLRVFWQIDSLDKTRENGSRALAQKIISACNAGGSQNHLNEGYLLLTSVTVEEAETLAKTLLAKADLRHLKIKEIIEVLQERLSGKSDLIIFEGDKNWEILILGSVASKICNNYTKPIFLYSQGEKESHGAVRTPAEIDGVKAMTCCSKFLETYGGHPQAGGFRIKNKNMEKFKDCLIKYFRKHEKNNYLH